MPLTHIALFAMPRSAVPEPDSRTGGTPLLWPRVRVPVPGSATTAALGNPREAADDAETDPDMFAQPHRTSSIQGTRNDPGRGEGLCPAVGWHCPVMKMIKTLTAVVASACLAATPLGEASAAPHWSKSLKCEETDPEGRVVPTRYGNADLGWNHFSGKHNIKKCRVVDAALAGKVDKKNGGRLEYYGVARNQTKLVEIVVIVQYARRTADGEYDAGRG